MRVVVALVIRTGLDDSYWLNHSDPRILDTAMDLLREEADQFGRR